MTQIQLMHTEKQRSPPKILFANITNNCNLECEHCYFNSGNPLPNELSTKEWYNIIDQLADYGVDTFRINGGEPLTRRDVYDILDYSKSKGLENNLITNGVLISKETLERLKSNLDIIYFSLDGTNPKTHDYLRRYGGLYDKVINGIKLAKKEKFRVGICTTVSKVNSYGVEELIPVLEDLGVEKTSFLYCSPFGSAKSHWSELYIGPKEWRNIQDRIQGKVDETNPKMKVFIEPRFRKISDRKDAQCSLYKRDICSIDPEGDVYFCSIMIEHFKKRWSLGNLRKQSFVEIWDNSNGKWKSIRNQRNIRVNIDCNGCDILDICGGGCTGSNLINGSEFCNPLEEKCVSEYYPICFMRMERLMPKLKDGR